MDVTLILFSRNRETGLVEQDGSAILYRDDAVGGPSALERAQRYGERWRARAPGDHTFEVHRHPE